MSLDWASCHCNASFCQKTTFALLNLNSCDWIVDYSLELYTSCYWMEVHVTGTETSFHRASSLLKKRLSPRMLFQIIFREVVLHRWCFAVWKVRLEMDNLIKGTDFTPWGGWPPGEKYKFHEVVLHSETRVFPLLRPLRAIAEVESSSTCRETCLATEVRKSFTKPTMLHGAMPAEKIDSQCCCTQVSANSFNM